MFRNTVNIINGVPKETISYASIKAKIKSKPWALLHGRFALCITGIRAAPKEATHSHTRMPARVNLKSLRKMLLFIATILKYYLWFLKNHCIWYFLLTKQFCFHTQTNNYFFSHKIQAKNICWAVFTTNILLKSDGAYRQEHML